MWPFVKILDVVVVVVIVIFAVRYVSPEG